MIVSSVGDYRMEKNIKQFSIFILITAIIIILNTFLNTISGPFDFHKLGDLVTTVFIILAIVAAIYEKNYFVAIVISMLKILLFISFVFLDNLKYIGSGTHFNFTFFLGLLATATFIFGICLLCAFMKSKMYKTEVPSLQSMLWPFVVLAFYVIFDSIEHGIVIALAELLALILATHLAENLLWVGAFIYIPFNLTQTLIDKTTSTVVVVEWIVGFIILIFAITALIKNLNNIRVNKKLKVNKL